MCCLVCFGLADLLFIVECVFCFLFQLLISGLRRRPRRRRLYTNECLMLLLLFYGGLFLFLAKGFMHFTLGYTLPWLRRMQVAYFCPQHKFYIERKNTDISNVVLFLRFAHFYHAQRNIRNTSQKANNAIKSNKYMHKAHRASECNVCDF